MLQPKAEGHVQTLPRYVSGILRILTFSPSSSYSCLYLRGRGRSYGTRGPRRSAGVLLRHSPRRFVRLPSVKPRGRASVPPLGKMYTGIVTGNIVTEGVPLLTIGGPPLT